MPPLPFTLQRVAIVLAIVLVLAYLGLRVLRPKAERVVREHGLEAPAQSLGRADQKLMDMISSHLFSGEEEEDEYIDLDHPREKDILFLMNTFREGDGGARLSAARALILIQTPRAVGLLVRAKGNPDELAFFCEGALEILRFRTREEAIGLMVDVLEDDAHPVSEVCRPQLEEKLAFLHPDDPMILRTLLDDSRVRVRVYALKHLPVVMDDDLVALIGRLAESADMRERREAQRWLAGLSLRDASPAPADGAGGP